MTATMTSAAPRNDTISGCSARKIAPSPSAITGTITPTKDADVPLQCPTSHDYRT